MGFEGHRPIAVDLFAGAGGLSLGFEQAGFDIAAAVEIDPIHACVHHYNFPLTTTLPHSVTALSGSRIREMAGIEGRAVDVVIGGPPCQGFSLIGQRALDDPRNLLVSEFVRIVRELDANYFVFENVKGLTVGKHRSFLDELVLEFSSEGYNVVMPWRILNAKDFGVPQDRERLFLIGAKMGLPLPEYPIFKGARVTCADALNDLPNAELFQSLLSSDEVHTTRWKEPSAYARTLRPMRARDWYFGYRRQWDPTLLTSSLRARHTEESRLRFRHTKPGDVEPISRFLKLHPRGVSNTLRAGTDSARGAFTSPRPIHYRYPRCVTVREMARLHGYPDWFRFHKTKWHGARQIGNSVPPPLARAVATSIMDAAGHKPTPMRCVHPLGDARLLGFDMSQAAVFWGIEIPIANRYRGQLKGSSRVQPKKLLSVGR